MATGQQAGSPRRAPGTEDASPRNRNASPDTPKKLPPAPRVADLPPRRARQLRDDAVLLPGGQRTGEGAVHAVQAGSDAKRNVAQIYSRGESITGRFRAPVTYPRDTSQRETRRRDSAVRRAARTATGHQLRDRRCPRSSIPGSRRLLIDNGVEISAEPIQAGGSPLVDAAVRLRPGAPDHRASTSGCSGAPRSRAAASAAGCCGIGKSKARRYDQETDTQGHLRRRGRHRRGRERAGRDRRLPQGPGEVHAPRRHRAEGRAAGRRAGHRQDAARARGGRRGGRAVLLDERARSSSR